MATANDFLSYTGNANLGLGTDAGIPVSNPDELGFVNQNLRDIALQDHQNQILKYRQAIEDRDKMYESLHDGTIKVGDVLDQDRGTVNDALDKQTKAFGDWMKKGYGDVDGQLAYRKATQAANEVVTQAQARKAFYDKENDAITKEPLPKYQQARKSNLDNNLTNFWGNLTPYEPSSRLDMGRIDKYVNPFQTQIADDKNHPLEKGTRTYFSYGDALKNAGADFLTPDGSYNLQQFHDTLTGMNPQDLYNKIKTINDELARYNSQRGLQEGDSDYATPVQAIPQYDKNGALSGVALNEALPALAAKFSLAGQPQYQSDKWDLDKGKQELAKLDIDKERANSDAIYKRAMAAAAGTKARAYAANVGQQMSIRKTQAERDQFLDELWNRNLTQQRSLIGPKGATGWQSTIKADESLPIYTIKDGKATQLMPIDAQPVYDKVDSKGNPQSGAKVLYYKGGHYDPEYMINGKTITGSDIDILYNKFKKAWGSKWTGGLDDYLKNAIDAGKISVRLKGANGTTDQEMSRAAQQLISNKATGKGEAGVFDDSGMNPPADETIIEENRSSNREDNQ